MKPTQYYIATGLGALGAILGLILLIMGSAARGLQADVQKLQTQYQTQQEQINAGVAISQQVIPNLFKDLSAHPESVGIKALMARHGAAPGSSR